MLLMNRDESLVWAGLAREVMAQANTEPHRFDAAIRSGLLPAFRFFIGAQLAAAHREPEARRWFVEGAKDEHELLLLNTFVCSFLKRQQERFIMPAVAFEDPQPFVHFSTTPEIVEARLNLVHYAADSLPDFTHPLRIMDIGTGNGALLVALIEHLREAGRVGDLGELLLIDASPGMLELAERTVRAALPAAPIRKLLGRFEEVSSKIEGAYDIALASLAYHHMPYETKAAHLRILRDHIAHLLLFELGANNDTPELHSPELALSVYQSYGRVIDFVFAHDTEVALANKTVDNFLMTEAVSLMTQPRGQRTEYHMLRGQWHQLFAESFDGKLACWGDATCLADEFLDLYLLHYGC